MTESLQPGALRWSGAQGPPDAAATEGLYKIDSSGFAEAVKRCISIITLYLRPGLAIQWEQVERLLQRHCENAFEVNLHSLSDLTFNLVYPSRLVISSHQTFYKTHLF